MNAPDDYCELCDLPRSTCIHGRPPVVAERKAKVASTPKRSRTTRPKKSAKPVVATATRVVAPRWTSAESFKPLIVALLEQAGGSLATDEAFDGLERLTQGHLHAGDHERMPTGELRWRYAARRAQIALANEGVVKKQTPGVWQLA